MDDHVSGVQGLVRLWNKSGMQIMVLLSFGMQVFLLVFGTIRWRSSSGFVRLSLWLVYLLADSTAIYALGHLSVGSGGGSSEHQLLSFWAPFLLLHLGGPDNITAYALEDNQLWPRHLQILIVQVLGASYVTYKSMASGGGALLLLLASISMFVVGLAKYGERTWALKCSSISSIRSSLSKLEMTWNYDLVKHYRNMSDEFYLLVAHSSLHLCKAALLGIPVSFDEWSQHGEVSQHKTVEMQLSLMYDVLYTKAAVIHTWYGFCIRIVSVLGTATTFLLFQLDLTRTSRRGGNNNNEYNGGDVIVSYVLLVGALVLEAISLCKALVSSWTRSLLHSHTHSHKGQGWGWLLRALDFLGERVQPARSRLWQGSIGQYNLFHLCTRDSNKLGSRLAKKMGLEDWWNKLHFTGTFTPDDDFKNLVVRAVVGQTAFSAIIPRGTSILREKGLSLESLDLHPEVFGRDFNECILIWSIVTEKYIYSAEHKQEEDERAEGHKRKLIQAIEVLSNYLMFLLVVNPEMLPTPRPHEAHAAVCRVLDNIWSSRHHGDDERNSSAASHKSWNPFYMLEEQFQRLNELFRQDGPNASSRIKQRKELFSYMWNTGYDEKGRLYIERSLQMVSK
ncbi:hypothetical protein U9M48_000859 [Paspalum notatum var. saurae]|uniref:DUF4220 domain-containing protein n=1 Tax=Paspalum notatum var. saurae TaxID=547442 RepID=A0AAQ3PHD3_PASNO